MNNQAIIQGSIGAIARTNNQSIAETFINADCIVIVDTSGSMGAHDSRDLQSRYDVACQELAQLQNHLPGKIAVLSFSSEVMFCPSGQPVFLCGDTALDKALKFAKVADVPGMRFILISDGVPNDGAAALAVAKTYKNHIDVIYVGPEDSPTGRDFLARLALASGGKTITADRAKELAASVEKLLLLGA